MPGEDGDLAEDVDPNVTRALAMDDRQSKAYLVALYGEDWNNPNQDPELYAQSCYHEASETVPSLAREVRTLRERYVQGLNRGLATDPTVRAEEVLYAKCLTRHGIEAQDQAGLWGTLDSLAQQLSADGVLDSGDEQELKVVQESLQQIDSACSEDLMNARISAQKDFETTFERENRDELERFRVEGWRP